MNLWVDDVVQPEDYYAEPYTWVTNYHDAIEKLKTGEVKEVSLDFSLDSCVYCWGGACKDEGKAPCTCGCHKSFALVNGYERRYTGMDILFWMQITNIWPETVRCHSSHSGNRKAMYEFVDKMKPKNPFTPKDYLEDREVVGLRHKDQ